MQTATARQAQRVSAGILWVPEAAHRDWGGFDFDPFSTRRNPAGIRVTPETALNSTAVLGCIRVLGESVASLPLNLYKRISNGGKELATAHPLFEVLNTRPNGWQTTFEWLEQLMLHCCLYGQSFHELKSGRRGAITEIIPLHPSRMQIERLENGRLRYRYSEERGRQTVYTQDRIMHVRWLSDDGVNGMVPIELAQDAIALSRACEIHGATYFGNGARPGAVLETDQILDQQSASALRDNWERVHGGAGNSHKTAVLMGGLKVHELGSTNQDSQFLETRRFSVEEICRIFRVPPHLVGDLTRSSFSNIEQQSIDFLQHTLQPWLRRIEGAISRDILPDTGLFVEFDPRGLLRGDASARAAYANTLWNLGVASINELREWEGLNPVDDGDTRFVQLNMQTLTQATATADMATMVDEGSEVDSGPDSSNPAGDETVAEVSLNGAQISGLLQILEQLAQGLIDHDAAKSLIAAAFPSIPQAKIEEFVAGTKQAPPPPIPGAPPAALEPTTEPEPGELLALPEENRNCGTGAVGGKKGFQSGNTCAKGGGSSSSGGGSGSQEGSKKGLKAGGSSTAARYVHKDGKGLLNNSGLNYDKLTDDEYFEVEEGLLGLQQPPRSIHGKDVTFVFTEEGEVEHERLIGLLKKASKTGVERQEIDLNDYDEVVWESSDGQVALAKSSGSASSAGTKLDANSRLFMPEYDDAKNMTWSKTNRPKDDEFVLVEHSTTKKWLDKFVDEGIDATTAPPDSRLGRLAIDEDGKMTQSSIKDPGLYVAPAGTLSGGESVVIATQAKDIGLSVESKGLGYEDGISGLFGANDAILEKKIPKEEILGTKVYDSKEGWKFQPNPESPIAHRVSVDKQGKLRLAGTEESIHREVFQQLKESDGGGFTVHPQSGRKPASGYQVSVHRDAEMVLGDAGSVTPSLLTKYVGRWRKELAEDGDLHVGGWYNKEDGKVYVDLSKRVPSRTKALALAKKHRQYGIWNNNKQEFIDTSDLWSGDLAEGEDRSGITKLKASRRTRSPVRGRRNRSGEGGGDVGSVRLRSKSKPRGDGGSDSKNGRGVPEESRNCGTGAVGGKKGFQSGNNCAKGGGASGGSAGGSGDTEDAASSGSKKKKQESAGGLPQSTAPDSYSKHIGDDGNFTPERLKLHKQIIDKATAGVEPSSEPTLYLMGGGPASGKSSIIRSGDVVHPEKHVLANPDEFKAEIPEYKEMTSRGDLTAAAYAHEESSHLNKQVMATAASKSLDTVWDGTGDSSIGKLEGKLKAFRDGGFKIKADYVTVDTETAVERSMARGKKTGRYVPPSVIRETHAEVSRIWPQAIKKGLFDEANLWDTNAGGKPKKIATVRRKKVTILDKPAYKRFLAKAEIVADEVSQEGGQE